MLLVQVVQLVHKEQRENQVLVVPMDQMEIKDKKVILVRLELMQVCQLVQ